MTEQEMEAWVARQDILLKKAGFNQGLLSPREWTDGAPEAVRSLVFSFSRK
jgi:hypothetical protein